MKMVSVNSAIESRILANFVRDSGSVTQPINAKVAVRQNKFIINLLTKKKILYAGNATELLRVQNAQIVTLNVSFAKLLEYLTSAIYVNHVHNQKDLFLSTTLTGEID